MGTILQVEEHIGRLLETIIYPNGLSNASITGKTVKVLIGFPIKNEFDRDLENGISYVSVFPVVGMERNVTRYLRAWRVIKETPQTIFLRVDGTEIYVEGVADAEQVCLVRYENNYYSYETVVDDTLDSVALQLAAVIPGAVAVDNVITVLELGAETFVSTYATLAKEVKRQQKVFNIAVWAPDMNSRAILGDAIDVYFAENTRQLLVADDFFIYFFYRMTLEEDMIQKNNIFKRSIEYNVEYPTVVTRKYNRLVSTDVQLEIQQ